MQTALYQADKSMDISKINDLTQLKAFAYDEMLVIENAQRNLQTINTRIAQLKAEQAEKEKDA